MRTLVTMEGEHIKYCVKACPLEPDSPCQTLLDDSFVQLSDADTLPDGQSSV